MHYKSTFFRILFGFVFLVSFGTTKGQTQLDSLQAIYESLPATLYPSQILHNRSPKYLWSFTVDSTLQWQANNNYTSSPYLYPGEIPASIITRNDWEGIYGDLKISSTNPALIPDAPTLNTRDSIAQSVYEVPIGAMHLDFHRILPGAVDSGYLYFDTTSERYTMMPDTLWVDKPNNIYHYTANPDSLAQLAMEENEVFVGVLTVPVIYKKGTSFSVTFGLASSLFIENQTDQVTYVEMDFDDGNGFVPTPFDVPKTVTYSFTSGLENYEKILRLRLHYGSKVVETRMKFHAVPNNSGADEVFYSSSLPFTCPVPMNGYVPGQVRVSVRYGNPQGKILKPILLVEGFESSIDDYGVITFAGLSSGNIYDEEKRVFEHVSLLKDALDSLHALGYDIIYQDNKNGRASIQSNALSTIKIIQWINAELQANESHEKPVVIGASMGGLLVRYALSKMEADGCCHNTRLYGTFDTPHDGAHIPLGLQAMVKHLHDDWGWIDPIIPPLFDIDPIKPNWADALNGIGARQMLATHIGEGAKADREAFMREFDSLGHPQQCRQIAIINGSEQGMANTIVDANKTYILCQPHLWLPAAHHVGTTWEPWANIIGIPIPFRTIVLNAYAESNPDGVIFRSNDMARASKLAGLIVATHGTSVSLQLIGQGLTLLFPLTGNALILTCQSVSNIALPGMHAMNLIDDVFLSSSQTHIATGNQNYSESPGSTKETPQTLAEALSGLGTLITPTHSFIPSVSGLDLDTNDLYLNIEDNRIPFLISGKIPFDTYWAPGRGDNPSDLDRNMEHIAVTRPLYRWLITQIDHNDDLRDAASGDYHKNLTGYYNFGRTADFEDPFLKHIYSVTIEDGGNLHINTDGPIGFLASTYISPQGGSFTCYTGQNCENPHIKIKDGGLFEVGRTVTNNRADMIFRPTSTLEIFTGGTLRIHDLSRLVLEDGAELIIHPGAIIELLGEGSELVLEGKVTLKPNANFTFSGDGFVIFDQKTTMNQLVMNQYWSFEGNNKIILSGNGKKTDVVAKVKEDLHLSGAMVSLDILDGKVEMGAGTNVSLRSSFTFNNTMFYAADSTEFSENYGHILAFGQPGVTIENTDFVGGNKGLYLMSILGTPGTFQSLYKISARRCETGVLTEGKSVHIDQSSFAQNRTGWLAENMTDNCEVRGSLFTNNIHEGIEFYGQSSAMLNVSSSEFSNNHYGVYLQGSMLRADCSGFTSNSRTGLYVNNAMAFLDHQAGNSFSGNLNGIELSESMGLTVEGGYNSFSSNTMDMIGTFSPMVTLDIYQGSPALNIGDNSFASGPVNLPTNLTIYGNQVALYNYTPVFMTPCQGIGLSGKTIGEISEEYSSNELYSTSGKSSSSGVYYNSGDPIDLSIQQGLHQLSTQDNVQDDLQALGRLQEILNSGFTPQTYDEQVLDRLAYQGVLLALSNAYLLDSLHGVKGDDTQPVTTELASVINLIDQRLSKLSTTDSSYAQKRFELTLDKALTYRLGEHYDLTLAYLDSVLNLPSLQADQSLRANRWKCVCEAESKLLDSLVTIEQYMEQVNTCQNSFSNKLSHSLVGTTTPLSYQNPFERFFTIMPNPTDSESRIVFHGDHQGGKVQVLDVTGQVVSTYDVEKGQNLVTLKKEVSGTYFIRVSLKGKEIETQKWMVIP